MLTQESTIRRSPVREHSPARSLYLVWKGYQRRAEVLAPLFGADLLFIPHLVKSRFFRPFDYLWKSIVSIAYLRRTRPDYVILQVPPHLVAITALLTGIPYVLDAHNALFQSVWGRLPFVRYVLRGAKGIIVHNEAIEAIASDTHPDLQFHTIADPLEEIRPAGDQDRRSDHILFICSFDRDEPSDVIVDVIERMSDYEFVVTADIGKLPRRERQRLLGCDNVRLTGFLSREDYHQILCSSAAAVALTTKDATQQSGACEALSSDTPLIVSGGDLSKTLFGSWARIVTNDAASIARAIRSIDSTPLSLSDERTEWNDGVAKAVRTFRRTLRL